MSDRIVIVGASLAGASTAATLRERGFDGPITLIGEETDLPYERPPLSKAILLGEAEEPDWVRPADFWAGHDIDLQLGTTATRIDRDRSVVLAGGVEYGYDQLVLATGSAARRLDLPGADLAGLLTLRTLEESRTLRSRFTDGARVVVVGAGWIGCEVGAAARSHGASVIMVDPLSQPLVRVVGDQVGSAFADLHREHGVDLRLGTGVTGFDGENGTVSSVLLEGGVRLEADTVVVGVGAAPNIALADAAGLELADGGVAVDATLRSSDPAIWAVGDVAAHAHPDYPHRVRVEHWANAKDQGEHLAGNLMGAAEPYRKRPFFFSDQYDLGCEYRGQADPAHDRMVLDGDLEAREFTAFWLRDGAVVAAMNVNQWDNGDFLTELVDTGRQVSDHELRS